MTNNERKLLVMLADCMIKQASALEANMIFELRNGVVDNANNSAEALAKEVDTEIAATTVGISRVKIDDLFKAFQTFQSEMQQAATNHSKIFAARAKFREFCERHRLPIDWNDHSGA